MVTVNPAAHQFGRKLRQTIVVTTCKAIHDVTRRPAPLTEMRVQLWCEDHPLNGGSSDVSMGDVPPARAAFCAREEATMGCACYSEIGSLKGN